MKIRGQTVFEPRERIARLSMPEPMSGCWLWLSTLRNGYGRLVVGSRPNGTRRSVSAHKYAFEAHTGAVPRGMEVCHSCDTPACVNPDHLFVGTRQANVDDRERKGRNRIFRDELGRFSPDPPK